MRAVAALIENEFESDLSTSASTMQSARAPVTAGFGDAGAASRPAPVTIPAPTYEPLSDDEA